MNLSPATIAAMDKRPLSAVDTVIIHHSVANKTLDIAFISEMEKTSQGFVTIGYHVYTKCVDVKNDLWVCQMGRPADCVPAAAYGFNTPSYDICIGGNYHPGGADFLDEVSEHALKVVAAQIYEAKKKMPLKYLMGHRDVATLMAKMGKDPADFATACPGDRLSAQLHALRLLTGLAEHPGVV